MPAKTLYIRPEIYTDYEAIDHINRSAFGGDTEVILVRELRKTPEYNSDLSLVAEYHGRTVGYILFTRVRIQGSEACTTALSLAPMAVLPEYQNHGIGTELVRMGLDRARILGFGSVIVCGHPGFYPRFGFVPAGRWGLKAPFHVPEDSYMAMELVPGALDWVTGMVEYPEPFSRVN